jgi:hypothetical protein
VHGEGGGRGGGGRYTYCSTTRLYIPILFYSEVKFRQAECVRGAVAGHTGMEHVHALEIIASGSWSTFSRYSAHSPIGNDLAIFGPDPYTFTYCGNAS